MSAHMNNKLKRDIKIVMSIARLEHFRTLVAMYQEHG